MWTSGNRTPFFPSRERSTIEPYALFAPSQILTVVFPTGPLRTSRSTTFKRFAVAGLRSRLHLKEGRFSIFTNIEYSFPNPSDKHLRDLQSLHIRRRIIPRLDLLCIYLSCLKYFKFTSRYTAHQYSQNVGHKSATFGYCEYKSHKHQDCKKYLFHIFDFYC